MTKKKTSAKKKLLPAIGMLAISGAMLASSTYAWFTMNKEVTVTGMQVHTTVSSNLLISETNADAASYGNTLNQIRECLLEPSSTVNGINYFWTSTSNVDAAGDAIVNTYTAYNESEDITHTAAGKTAYDEAFNSNYGLTAPSAGYGTVAYGYVDYTFYLKAVNTDTAAKAVKLTKLNLLYENAAVTDEAWRAALIVQDASEYTALNVAPAAANVVSIFTVDGAENFTLTDYAVSATDTVSDLAYGDAGAITEYNQEGTFPTTVASGGTAYYKVTVRLWLEGEDKTCTNATYALLTGDYTLDLKFCFDDSDNPVENINDDAAVVNTSITGTGLTRTAALANGETASTYQWYNATTHTAITSATNASYTGSAGDKVYCIITTAKGTTYKTASATLSE